MGVVVTIAFDAAAEASGEARHTLDMAVRLAARLYPRIRILPLHGDPSLAAALAALAVSINPAITLEGSAEGARELALVVGATRHAAETVVYAGSDGWIARVSATRPVESGTGGNPFGAGAAACIGMANIFRAVFADRLPHTGLDLDTSLSLLNFETGASASTVSLANCVDIGEVRLVGVGAVGNAAVWSLTRVPGLAGTLHAIDHETVDLSNMQRYVLTSMADDGAVKVSLARREAAGTELDVVPSRATWAEHVAASGGGGGLVAVALDSARDRVEVQGSLPRRLVNAWTQNGDLGVSRHGFDGDQACLACMYLPQGRRRSLDEVIAGELGLDHATHRMRLRDMLVHGQPVGEDFAREIAAAAGVDPGSLTPFAAQPLRAFRQRAVCGGIVMRAIDGGGADVEVPLAFQSALAGVMLAAEVVAEAAGLRDVRPPTRSVVDLLRPLTPRPSSNVLKGTSPAARCICEDSDWQDAYRAKWSAPAETASDGGRDNAGPGGPPNSVRYRMRHVDRGEMPSG